MFRGGKLCFRILLTNSFSNNWLILNSTYMKNIKRNNRDQNMQLTKNQEKAAPIFLTLIQ